MGLKNIKLGMAEELSEELRKEHGLPDSGMVVIETLNPDLRVKISSIEDGGIHGYLKSLGPFNDVKIDE